MGHGSGEIGDFQQVFGKDELDSGKKTPFWSVSEKGFPYGKGNFKIPVSGRAGFDFSYINQLGLWVMAQLVILASCWGGVFFESLVSGGYSKCLGHALPR